MERRDAVEGERAGWGGLSDGQSKGADNAVHGLVLPSHSAAPVGGAVPEAGACRVQACSILLHDHTGHDVLKWFPQLGELA